MAIQRPGLKSSFSRLIDRHDLVPALTSIAAPPTPRFPPLERNYPSEKHFWSTITRAGPMCGNKNGLFSLKSFPIHSISVLAVFPITEKDRDPLNDFFLSATFPALTTLHNTPALTTISLNAHWQVPRPAVFARLKHVSLTDELEILPTPLGLLRAAPLLGGFRLGCGYYKDST
ncbi:uncharacterized protein BXZ73DRAFT_106015 [Epithele typhae]|uniref:uncharacterized protein n=1 Tax=Epithele typhae TaxID=378194 RepID=UPI002007BB4B|nr:uncharacterized protein BXZ73DRAFT_106015 [Epithele typhae]KAH9915949.1 hypothetical protein BXZ73DRAFT_106015 [Epithele typhae]